MPKFTLNGRALEFQPGETIIQTAANNGIDIPHFCWHPKLSVSGNCRMCLVEVEKMPKLVIACSTQSAEGMVVHSANEKVIKARNVVMEFLLINHPLDCPICDEAGECKLQDYAYKYSIGYSRFQEDKVHKPKRVELGPKVMLDDERCIMCSRCVRFADEIAHQPVLTFTQRGTHVVLTTFPGTQLDNPYSMNVIELCPVGALTSRDFRFKSRVWEMSSSESVCSGCSRGCNTNMWVRNNEVLRLTPRHNEEVNSYWMCDEGRLTTFRQVNSERRLSAPLVRKEGSLVETGWDEAISEAASNLKLFRKGEIAALGSAFATNEDNYLFQKLFKEGLGVRAVDVMEHIVRDGEDALLIKADKTPNLTGAKEVGIRPAGPTESWEAIQKGIKEGTIKALYVLEDNVAADPRVRDVLGNLDLLIVHSHERNETTELADVVFAASTYAEKHGTWVNFQRRVQRLRPAVATLEQDRALDGFAMSRWDKFAAHNDAWGKGTRRDARPSWRILAALGSALGMKLKYSTSEDVFRELAERVPAFKGFSYQTVGTRGRLLTSVPASPVKVGV